MLFGKHVNKYYKKYFWNFFFGILFLVAIDYIQLLLPEIIGNLSTSIQNQTITINLVKQSLLYILLIALGMFVGRFLWRICIFNESIKIQADLRKEMFLKSEQLSQRYYKENKTGAILSLYSNDLETIEEAFGFGIVLLVDGLFLGSLSLIKMFKLDYKLTLIACIPLFILCACGVIIDRYMEKKYQTRQEAFEAMSDFSQENFTGIRVIKAFVKEGKELRQFAKINKHQLKVNVDFVRCGALLDALIDLLIYSVIIIIMCLGGYYIYQSSIGASINFDSGKMITFLGYFDTIVWPVIALSQIINLVARSRTSLKRISKLLDEKIDISDENTITLDHPIVGNVEFKDFSFSYPDKPDVKVLDNISFSIKAGESVGIVGKIGSGKSTLVNILFRLYNVEENSVFIDGVDIMHLPIKSIRENIGYAPQDNFLFSDTIENNIAFALEDSTQTSISEAAAFSDVKDNIESFKDKYKTMLGERGVTLSGGQKQRISISRAIIKNPPILVLDDSVSAVDIKTEENILHNISKKRRGKTTILISSRVSTVEHLDKILVLDNGHMEAFGTHEQCLSTSPTYRHMVELQRLEKEMEG